MLTPDQGPEQEYRILVKKRGEWRVALREGGAPSSSLLQRTGDIEFVKAFYGSDVEQVAVQQVTTTYEVLQQV